MAYELKFGPPSDAFVQKHGALYCACCKKAGVRTLAVFSPLGWPRSVTFKRDFASCAEHLDVTKIAARRNLALEYDVKAESEGEYQARTQFGI